MDNNIIIVEDEVMAARHLQKNLTEVMPDAEVTCVLQTVEEAVEYFHQCNAGTTPYPNLVFMDIHLADGLAFRIFDQVQIHCPIVFTTAYDQYALDAFKAGAVDYLMKPINPDDLHHTIQKMRMLMGEKRSNLSEDTLAQLMATLRQSSPSRYRSAFLVPVRDKLVPIQVKEIACIYLEDKISRAILKSGQEQILDRPLDNIYESLDPQLFFRANRQYIISREAIKEIAIWPISKLAVTLSVSTPDKIIISKTKVSDFKQWYTN